jgi:hypothetical protein
MQQQNSPRLTCLWFDDSELQMLYHAVWRVKPFAEMGQEMATAEALLEKRLFDAVKGLTCPS